MSEEESAQFACGGVCETAACREGACRPELFVQDASEPTVLAVDSEYLYWAGSRDGVIRRRALAGGTTEVFATVEGYPMGLSRQGARLFYTTNSERGGFEYGVVASYSLPEGVPVVLSENGYPTGIAATADRVFWADFDAGVFSVKHSNGTPSGSPEFFGGQVNASGVCVFTDTVFWTQKNLDNAIRSQRASSSGPPSLLACHQEWPDAIVADAERVFWINKYIFGVTGRVMSLDRSGGAPKVLVEVFEPAPSSLAGDETTLYWVEAGTSIMRMRK
jgi:hypothetical protein